jgi:hypothetical protein
MDNGMKGEGVLRIEDGKPMPPLDPLTCEQAAELYNRGVENLNDAERFKLGLHIADAKGHEPECPAHDPRLLERLRTALGFKDLPAS